MSVKKYRHHYTVVEEAFINQGLDRKGLAVRLEVGEAQITGYMFEEIKATPAVGQVWKIRDYEYKVLAFHEADVWMEVRTPIGEPYTGTYHRSFFDRAEFIR